MVGELKLSLYGTRDAAMNWAKQYTQHLNKIGFQKGRASACNFVVTTSLWLFVKKLNGL